MPNLFDLPCKICGLENCTFARDTVKLCRPCETILRKELRTVIQTSGYHGALGLTGVHRFKNSSGECVDNCEACALLYSRVEYELKAPAPVEERPTATRQASFDVWD